MSSIFDALDAQSQAAEGCASCAAAPPLWGDRVSLVMPVQRPRARRFGAGARGASERVAPGERYSPDEVAAGKAAGLATREVAPLVRRATWQRRAVFGAGLGAALLALVWWVRS